MNCVVVRRRFSLGNLVVRGALLALLCGAGAMAQAWADEPVVSARLQPRMAKGLIVKLKDGSSKQDSGAHSVVRLHASAMPSDSSQRLRLRLAAAAQRHRVSYLVQRPTAFAATLIHSGRQVPYEEAQAEAERLRKDADVEWVIVNEVERAAAINPALTEPDYGSQTWLQARQTFTNGRKGVANIAPAWSLMDGHTLTPVMVAVLDTGKLDAPDLAGRMAQGYDMVSEVDYAGDGDGQDGDSRDPGIDITRVPPSLRTDCAQPATQWHGLSIAGMLGAIPNNGVQGAGILTPVPGQVVLPVRVAGMCGAAVSDIIEGMLWAAGVDYQGSPAHNTTPARVINLSFGGDGACADQGNGAHDTGWLYRQTIQTLESKGVLVVASAGNGDEGTGRGLAAATRPANCPGVLAVTALNQAGYKARYANLLDAGTQASLAVSGGDVNASHVAVDDGVWTVTNDGGTSPASTYSMRAFRGTSAAAPTAAGVAALMLAIDPNYTVAELRKDLTDNVELFPTGFSGIPACVAGQDGQGNCVCTTATCGAGILDAARAVTAAIAHAAVSTPLTPVASSDTCYFRPDRLGGGNTCPVVSNTTTTSDGGGGGGGAVDAWCALALMGLAGLAWSGQRRAALSQAPVRAGRR